MELSLLDTVVTFNGHTVEKPLLAHTVMGWSEDAGALTLPDALELVTVRRGALGDMAVFRTGDRGGQVSLSLLPNSPSVKFFMQQMTLILSKKLSVVWEGNVQHTLSKASVKLKRGVLMSGPLWYTMGKGEVGNLTFTWEFEDITPSFDKVDFDYVPISNAASGNGGS